MNKAHHVCEIRDAFYPSQSLFGLVFSSFIALHGTTNYGFFSSLCRNPLTHVIGLLDFQNRKLQQKLDKRNAFEKWFTEIC